MGLVRLRGKRVTHRRKEQTFRPRFSFSHLYPLPPPPLCISVILFPFFRYTFSFLFIRVVSSLRSTNESLRASFLKKKKVSHKIVFHVFRKKGKDQATPAKTGRIPHVFCKGNPWVLFICGMKRLERTGKHRKPDKFHPAGAEPTEVLHLKRENLCLYFYSAYNV